MRLYFRWVSEEVPGPRWTELYQRSRQGYLRWFRHQGDAARPDLKTCRRALRTHMPELVPMWERLVELAGGEGTVARLLSLYRPTPYLFGCSQAVWTRGRPLLVRNYDYLPGACEGTFLFSNWSGTRVLASSDCLWGVLDGLNEHGLAVALSFGGQRVVGDGFGIPLVLRYVLESCETTAQAVAVLRRVPSHMAYNVSVVDGAGAHKVVQLGPGRRPIALSAAIATNHQRGRTWSAYDRVSRSAEREAFLDQQLADPSLSADRLPGLFLRPPLFAPYPERPFPTLYTAVYRPGALSASFLWPGAAVTQSFDAFEERDLVVPLGSPRVVPRPPLRDASG